MDKDAETVSSETEPGEIPVKIKQEAPEDMKNFVTDTMNEFLSIFGYEKVNKNDTQHLNLEKFGVLKEADASDVTDNDDVPPDDEESMGSPDSATERIRSRLRKSLKNGELPLSSQYSNLASALKKSKELEGELEDQGSTGDSVTPIQCSWCQKQGTEKYTLKTATGTRAFCSDICFGQCRRASFKKSKACEWCKHVRHTVNYVDFQDGEHQLQFCSAKCLNQYKMNIFCKETQEHLSQIKENSDDSATDKNNEEILITPELWMNSESKNNILKEMKLRREKEKRDNATKGKQHSVNGPEKSHSSKSHEGIKSPSHLRPPLLDKIKTEAIEKSRHSVSRDSDRKLSPHLADSLLSSGQHGQPLPPHLLHPSIAAMAPWLQQAHLMGAMAPGLSPYGGIPPMLYPGFMPPYGPGFLPPDQAAVCSEKSGNQPSTGRASVGTSSVRMLSPSPDRSSTSGTPNSGHRLSMPQPPGSASSSSPSSISGRSRLFPFEFPQMFPNPTGSPRTQQPHMNGHMPGGAADPAGIPPVTVMVPFPIVLPFPIPIPVPIPLTMDQILKALNKDRSCLETYPPPHTDTVSEINIETRNPHDTRPKVSPHLPNSEQTIESRSDVHVLAQHYDIRRSRSRSSCPDMSLSDARSSHAEDNRLKRSLTPSDMETSLDLSKRPKIELPLSDSSNDVIDLSASRKTDTPQSTQNDKTSDSEDVSKVRDSNENIMESDKASGLTVPKIHIVTPRNDPPLNQHLPLPPTEQKYSTRRGLILDAPAVSPKPRSPSPDRRVYVRNMPRDIMEAARRRCLRNRPVRTK